MRKNIIKKNGLRIISAALLLFAGSFAAMPSLAEETGNLKLDVYNFSPDYLYPERNPELLTHCVTTYTDSISADWGGGDILGCGYDFVAIHYTGQLTFETDAEIYLMAIADDGFSLSLDGAPVIEDWTLKGCSGSVVSFTPVPNHTYTLDAWFYEYGGGACSTLYWMPADGVTAWDIVPTSYFAAAIPVEPAPEPSPILTPEPTIEPEPEPEPTETSEPLPLPTEEPQPVPAPEPEPVPVPEPELPEVPEEPQEAPEPTIEPEPSSEPVVTEQPAEELPEPEPEPSLEPAVEPEPQPEPEVSVTEQLALAAEDDDVEIPAELAAIPLLGNVASAVLDVFNNLGNVGADMSPETREESEKVVVGAIIAGQIAQVAASASVVSGASTRRNK